ncbi:MAG: DinB family protein [Candidatus Acidiferrales bacterium]
MNDKSLREHLKKSLRWHDAHADWKAALAGLSPKNRGVRPSGSPHSVWELFEHMRLAQRDILDFCINPKYVSPEWPSGYWPKHSAPPSPAAWNKSVKSFHNDLNAMAKLVSDPKIDLFARIPHGSGQTILREALLLAGHNSYHLGQIVLVRKLLGDWPAN